MDKYNACLTSLPGSIRSALGASDAALAENINMVSFGDDNAFDQFNQAADPYHRAVLSRFPLSIRRPVWQATNLILRCKEELQLLEHEEVLLKQFAENDRKELVRCRRHHETSEPTEWSRGAMAVLSRELWRGKLHAVLGLPSSAAGGAGSPQEEPGQGGAPAMQDVDDFAEIIDREVAKIVDVAIAERVSEELGGCPDSEASGETFWSRVDEEQSELELEDLLRELSDGDDI
jgi:hypothetical protein